VQVFDFGTQDGLPFFSLELCEGGSLATKLASNPLPAAQAALLVEQVARAVQAAHHKGIVHRDLKPANVLLDGHGQPKVSDFGLAKRIAVSSALTQTGAVIGSPSYMAPEQAQGKKDVGPSADVYALGAILYECLTGRPPFKAASVYDTLRQVVNDEVVPVRQLSTAAPKDLDTICQKCLQKDPGRRYDSPQSLADDLRRFLAGEPIRARPVRSVERGMLWVRRNPVVAALAASLVVALLAGVAGATLFALEARSEAGRATRKSEEAEREARSARLAEANARREARRAREREYGASMASAQHAWGTHQIPRFVAVLQAQIPRPGEEDFRTFEWYYWRNLVRSGHFTLPERMGRVTGLAFSPDGKRLASAGHDGTAEVWEVGTRQVVHRLHEHTGPVACVAWSPDGKRLATASADRTVILWDATTGKTQKILKGHASPVHCVAFNADGKQVASGGAELKWWDVATGEETRSTLMAPRRQIYAVAFSPDSKSLAAGLADGTVTVLSAATGKEVINFKGHNRHEHSGTVTSLAYCPDGRRLVSCGGWTAKVWDAGTGQEIQTFTGHNQHVHAVAFSPDGKRVASGCENRTVKVWEAATGQEVLSLQAHAAPVRAVAFSPDGKRVASGSLDGAVKVWDAINGQKPPTLTTRGAYFTRASVAFSPDGKRLASQDGEGVAKVWDVRAGRDVLAVKGPIGRVAFSPDGKRLASGTGGMLKLWDADTGRETLTLKALAEGGNLGFAFSPDGKRLAAPGIKGTVKVHDAATGQVLLTLWGHTQRADFVAYSPDGKLLASGGDIDDPTSDRGLKGEVKVWDALTGQELFAFPAGRGGVHEVVFSPDGKRLAAACHDGTVRMWSTATGELVHTLRGHQSPVYGVAFSPDGKRLSSGSWDTTVMLWDTATGLEVLTLRGYPRSVCSVAFSPDGRRLAARSDHGLVMIWDASSGE
jgi:WD40 repeat protein